jgi:hypothetical protein
MRTLILFLCASLLVTAQYRQGNARLGWQSAETILTPANVAGAKFGLRGRLCNNQITGAVYGQPVFVSAAATGSVNGMLVATMTNDVYLCDAANPSAAPLWHANLGTARTDIEGFFYFLTIGCLATPAVDPVNSVIYVDCATPTPTWVLYKLNLKTGATITSVTVTGAVPGTGDPCTTQYGNACTVSDTTSGGNVVFFPTYQLCRMAITLSAAGNIYVGCGSYADYAPWHGWMFAYNSSLSQIGAFCTTPSAEGGGLSWGGGAAEDGSGNLFVVTGNGAFDGTTSFGQSVLKFGSTLTLTDWFTPTDWSTRNSTDADIASSNPMLIPGTALISFSTKSFDFLTATTTCLGHLGGAVGGCPGYQVVALGTPVISAHTGSYGDLYDPNNKIGYFQITAGNLYRSVLTGTTWAAPSAGSATYAYPGGMMSGSSNGASNGIVWASSAPASSELSVQPGIIQALDPATLAVLWSSTNGGADAVGTFTKFQYPVVPGNGNVYLGTLSQGVAVYGQYSPTYILIGRNRR